MPKITKRRRLIVCCDGTGNEIKDNQSNVLKFYRVLKKDIPEQVAFYDTGIGTISNSGRWAWFKYKAKGVFGLATGYGLDENILDAFRFLIDNYKEGDEIWLFGFSRGAYTVRVLAGLINLVGLPHHNQRHLASYALTAYKQAATADDFQIAWRVQEVLDTQRPTIRFMGCWDTVGSVIIPRPDRAYLPSIEELPHTNMNPSVEMFRHAMAIDEKRRMFRVSRWEENQLFKTNPFLSDENAVPQDSKQEWFAGVHSDIGGGYPEQESGAAKYPLAWMVDEARNAGLVFREEMVKRLVWGKNPRNVKDGSERDYSEPDPTAKLHDSMGWVWRILEYIPKLNSLRDNAEPNAKFGFYFPKSEPRYIAKDAAIHKSVHERIKNGDYVPVNLPR